MLHCFPLELAFEVVEHLCLDDQFACSLVCRDWRLILTGFNFHHIHLRSRKSSRKLLQYLQHDTNSSWLKKHAGRLSVEDGVCTFEDVLMLARHIPRLKELSFRFEDNRGQKTRIQRTCRGEFRDKQRLFGTPALLLQRFPTLKHLKLSCKASAVLARRGHPLAHDIGRYLENADNLVSLEVIDVGYAIGQTSHLLDEIHSRCPHLQSLKIKERRHWESCRNAHDMGDFGNAKAKPMTAMEHVSVIYHSQSHTPYLLQYFASRYPNLKYLHLTALNKKDKHFHQQRLMKEATKQLAASCRCLERIELDDIVLAECDIRRIFSESKQLQHISLRYKHMPILEQPAFSTLLKALEVKTRLTTLHLSLPRAIYAGNEIWDLLHVPQLQHLRLDVVLDMEACALDAAFLIGFCFSNLRSLSLVGFSLYMGEYAQQWFPVGAKNHLTTLDLAHCCLQESFLTYLQWNGLPELCHLSLHHCMGGVFDSDGALHLNLDIKALTTLVIHNLHGRYVDFWTTSDQEMTRLVIAKTQKTSVFQIAEQQTSAGGGDLTTVDGTSQASTHKRYYDDDYDPFAEPKRDRYKVNRLQPMEYPYNQLMGAFFHEMLERSSGKLCMDQDEHPPKRRRVGVIDSTALPVHTIRKTGVLRICSPSIGRLMLNGIWLDC